MRIGINPMEKYDDNDVTECQGMTRTDTAIVV